MDNLGGNISPEKKGTKKAKTKKRPMKVVYISNPMKFKTSASEFRALVQELTGQDAELPDPSRFVDGEGYQTVPDVSSKAGDDHHAQEVPAVADPSPEQARRVQDSQSIESFDDVFMPQMLESFSGLMPTSSFIYESGHVDALRSLDAM